MLVRSLVAVLALSISQAFGAIINVPADQPTIQAAIDASVDGDEIVVAPGTYFENINMLGKAVRLRSTDPSDQTVVEATVIDGQQAGSVITCDSGEGLGTVISGLTIQNGEATSGGGINIDNASSPTISNCIFVNNLSTGSGIFTGGGGISTNFQCSPAILNCVFENNTASFIGGGISNSLGSTASMRNCVFFSNTALRGGGMGNFGGNPSVENCSFHENEARDGGGAYIVSLNGMFTQSIRNCSFIGNIATSNGGGIEFGGGSTHVVNCVFIDNLASIDGGGIQTIGPSTNPTITNSSFIRNSSLRGGGLAQNNSGPRVINSIFWDNTPEQISPEKENSSIVNATYSLIQDGFPGIGNIDGIPQFVDPSNGDYRLSPNSPAIDAGDNTAVPADVLTDLDGNPRFFDDIGICDSGIGTAPIVDIGVYEFQGTSVSTICLGDCNLDGTVNFSDLVSTLAQFGLPNGCTCDADGSGTVDFSDLVAALGLFGPCP